VLIGCALLLWMGVPADAAPLTCDQVTGGTPTSLTVTTQAQADQIKGNGINDDDCVLTINTSILPTIPNFLLEAKSITVQGPSLVANGPPAPISTNVQIVNPNAGSNVTLLAKDFIKIDQGSIKATAKVHIECTGALCPLTVTGSELMATSTVTTAVLGGFGGPGGRLEVEAKGDLSVTTTSFTGGDKVLFDSADGSVTALCGPGGGGCKDPNIPPIPKIVLDNCEDPANPGKIKFPCTLTDLTEAELTSVCIETPGSNCDGGAVEKDFLAKGLINLEGSTITAQRHVNIKSVTGPIKAANFTLKDPAGQLGSVVIQVQNGATSSCPIIDLTNADINNAPDPLKIAVLGGCHCGATGDIVLTGAMQNGVPLSAHPTKLTVNACSGNGTVKF
jgi:hypothetical protein